MLSEIELHDKYSINWAEANDLHRLQTQGYLIRDFDVDLKKLIRFCEQVGIDVRLVEGGWIGVRFALVTPQGIQEVLNLLADERGRVERLLNSNQSAYDTLVDFREATSTITTAA